MANSLEHWETILRIIAPYIVPAMLALTAVWAVKRIDFSFKFTRTVKGKSVEKSSTVEIRAKYNE